MAAFIEMYNQVKTDNTTLYTGVGVMFEGDAANVSGGLCEDVDIVHQGGKTSVIFAPFSI